MKNNFESLLVRSIRHYFTTNHITAFTERRPQTRYKKQFVDIIIDSPTLGYIAVECKSIGGKYLHFSANFSEVEDGLNHVHQVETINYYITQTGRTGYLAVEVRSKAKKIGNRFYMIPWGDVLARFNNGSKGYNVKELRQYPEVVKDIVVGKTKLYNVRPLFTSQN